MIKDIQIRYKTLIPSLAIFFAFFWAILLIFVSWFYRDDAFQTIYDPRQPFQTYAPSPAPDYTKPEAWLTRPDPSIDPINITGGDIFVVAPTFYLGSEHWNAPTDDPKVLKKMRRIALPNYIIPYEIAGRVYSPHYRQAALYSFLNNTRDDSRASQKLAYRDIKRAFEQFLSENPPERPIILVGHGQGGLHVQRLLQDFFQGRLSNKLAVAYIIDHPVPMSRFDTVLSKLHPCESEKDIQCVVSFGAFRSKEKKRIRLFKKRTLIWQGSRLKLIEKEPLLCTNPLTWSRSTEYAPPRLHLGGAVAEGLGVDTLPAPSPQQTGAQCKNGILLIDKPKQKSLRRPNRFGGKFRTHPSNLFFEDMRIDAERRMQTMLALDILPKRAPIMEIQTIEIEESPVTLPLKKMKQ